MTPLHKFFLDTYIKAFEKEHPKSQVELWKKLPELGIGVLWGIQCGWEEIRNALSNRIEWMWNEETKIDFHRGLENVSKKHEWSEKSMEKYLSQIPKQYLLKMADANKGFVIGELRTLDLFGEDDFNDLDYSDYLHSEIDEQKKWLLEHQCKWFSETSEMEQLKIHQRDQRNKLQKPQEPIDPGDWWKHSD